MLGIVVTHRLCVVACALLVVECELSCPEACGILVPPAGIEPMSPELEGGFLTTGTTRAVPLPPIRLRVYLCIHVLSLFFPLECKLPEGRNFVCLVDHAAPGIRTVPNTWHVSSNSHKINETPLFQRREPRPRDGAETCPRSHGSLA